MRLMATPIPGCYEIELKTFEDERGRFMRTFCQQTLKEHGIHFSVAQSNSSQTWTKGTLRGLHYQVAPHAESKIVRVLKGKIYDVCVDLRKDSPTFARSYGAELSDENLKMLLLPKGCAHGFQTLVDNCEMLYFHDESYHLPSDRVASHQDPMFGIQWPLPITSISRKDKNAEFFPDSFKGIQI